MCTVGDVCMAGVCVPGAAKSCSALDQCHVAGTCDPGSGVCSNPTKGNGTSCNDGNSCTTIDQCMAGSCVGTTPIICTASDQCHVAGTCDPGSGTCSNPAASDGTGCSDGNACTQSDTCQSGSCQGGNPVTCTPLDSCHTAGTCDPGSGTCSNPAQPDNTSCAVATSCTLDVCQSGVCQTGPPKCDPTTTLGCLAGICL
jgi:hypothetical protein